MKAAQGRVLDGLVWTVLLALCGMAAWGISVRYKARQAEAASWEALFALRSAQVAYREDPQRGAGHYARDLAALGRKTPQGGPLLTTTDSYSEAVREGLPTLRLYHNGTRDDTITP